MSFDHHYPAPHMMHPYGYPGAGHMFPGGFPHSVLVANDLADTNTREAHENTKITALEAEVSNLRIQNSTLMAKAHRQPRFTDSKEKIHVLTELNDKLELDLDLALKELSLNKRKSDSVEAQLAQALKKNAELEQQVHTHKYEKTNNEKRMSEKRDWAERRLNDEESTVVDLRRQVSSMQAEMIRMKQDNEAKIASYEKEYKAQEGVIANMKLAHRARLAEAEEALRTAAKRARVAPTSNSSAMFNAFDANGDGVMDEEEFAAVYAAMQQKTQHRPYPAPGTKEKRFDYQKA